MIKHFQKYSLNGYLCKSNAVYYAEHDDNTFFMNFLHPYFFSRELQGLSLVKNKDYCPEIISIDPKNLQITFKWYQSSLNHLLNNNSKLPIDWKEQIKFIVSDLENSGILKINCYPHTFYVKENKIHIMDLYACSFKKEIIKYEDFGYIINDFNRFKFVNGILDVESTYNYTIKNNCGFWPEDFLNG
jgi:hypothetical protein